MSRLLYLRLAQPLAISHFPFKIRFHIVILYENNRFKTYCFISIVTISLRHSILCTTFKVPLNTGKYLKHVCIKATFIVQ